MVTYYAVCGVQELNTVPANTLNQRRWWWNNIKPTLVNLSCFLGLAMNTRLFRRLHDTSVSNAGSLRDREVACSASDRQGSNFESCVWKTVSSQSSHHPQEVLLAQFSLGLYVHKGGLKPDSFHLYDTSNTRHGVNDGPASQTLDHYWPVDHWPGV